MTLPLNVSEVELEVTLFWYKPHCFCCVNRVILKLATSHLNEKIKKVCIKAWSPPALSAFTGQVTGHATYCKIVYLHWMHSLTPLFLFKPFIWLWVYQEIKPPCLGWEFCSIRSWKHCRNSQPSNTGADTYQNNRWWWNWSCCSEFINF